jgi:arylsulfatase A-like enzyme
MIRRGLGDPVVAGVAAGVVVGAIEGVALLAGGAALGLVAVALALSAGAGLVVGGAVAIALGLSLRLRLSGPLRAAILAAPAIAPVMFVASSLFEGSLAATLPGAESAWLWMPALAWLGLAAVVWFGDRQGWRRYAVGGLATFAFAVAEIGNRVLFRSGYPDVHFFLIVVALAALVAGGLAFAGVSFARPRALVAVVVATCVSAGLAIFAGLTGAETRAQLTVKGNHVRHLVRFVRDRADSDGDGYSTLLGGGDCDDSDPERNPGAADAPGNGIDEDCDGRDAETVVVAEESLTRDQAYQKWRASESAAALRARVEDMNLLLISVDALRADRAYRGPALSGLRDRAVVFERAYAPGAGTDLSLSSLVTGRIDPFRRLDTTVFEALSDRGRPSFALLPREVLRYAGATLLTRGLDGHATIVNDREQRDVGNTTTSVETTGRAISALRRLRKAEQPFTLWVHYFDVHEHLQVEQDDPGLRSVGRTIDGIESKYEALILLTDREIGRLLEAVSELELDDDTVVVMVSDHGESLGEDPRLPDNHGLVVYEPLVRIPVLVAIPGVGADRIEVPISLVDVSATLAELFALDGLGDLPGDDLSVFFDSQRPPELNARSGPIVLNESEQWGVIEWPYKLMVRPADNLVELYQLDVDPGEKSNLASGDPERVSRLKALYAGFPRPNLDRTRKARRARERLAQPPARRRK